MARPKKCRKVCCLPAIQRFGSLDPSRRKEGFVTMTIDEYETIRLIDFEGLIQEECATQMKVARTTVQGIYTNARKKIAELLIEGKMLLIEGGEYQLCNGRGEACGRGACHRRNFDLIKKKDCGDGSI